MSSTSRDEFERYDAAKGAIRFPPERPLPAALECKLVKTRIAEQAGKKPAAARKSRAK